jgi:hypothetical protein
MIKIEKANNGYIVRQTHMEEEAETVTVIEGKIVEGKTGSSEEENAFMDLCLFLAEQCGFTYNKFGSYNFMCSFDKVGHKVEEKA